MSAQGAFLPSPRSYLTLPSLPPLPSSILSTPLPTSLSMPSFQSQHDLECQPQHHRPFTAVDRTSLSFPVRAVAFTPQHQEEESDSLLKHTASVLVLSALEQKGQSWLAARKSSTSLSLSLSTSPTALGGEYFSPNAVYSHAYSPRSSALSTPRAARSRHHSRRSSTSKSAPILYSAADFVQREPLLLHEPGFDLNDVRSEKLAAMTVENEVRRLLMARVGGWLEWAVGWMDFGDDGDDDDHEVDKAPRVTPDVMKIRGRTVTKRETKTFMPVSESKLDSAEWDGGESGSGDNAIRDVSIPPPPPTHPQGSSLSGTLAEPGAGAGAGDWAGVHEMWWQDAKWLLGVAGKVAW